MAAVIMQEPNLDAVPVQVRKLLRRCLEKDPKHRLRDIGEARFLLIEEPKEEPALTPQEKPSGNWVAWTAAGVLAIAVVGLGYVAYRHNTEEVRVERFSLLTPDQANMNGVAAIPAISPDGRRVAVALNVDGQVSLWIRDLDGLNFRALSGTTGAGLPFWSPDSRWVGFFADNKLKKIDVTGGPALTLCDVTQGRGGSWNQDGVIVYGILNGGLFRVPAAGGSPVALSERDTDLSARNHRTPWFLPDGRHFLYTARSGDAQKTRIYVDDVGAKPDSKTRREVLAADSNAVYVPSIETKQGYLLFVREQTLMAQPFDPSKAQTTGDAVPVAEHVDYLPGNSQGQFSASQNGTLVYTSGAVAGRDQQLTWFDRSGKALGTVGPPAGTQWASISPDGARVAMDRRDAANNSDIWLLDLTRGAASRFTFGPQLNEWPIWSPDGSHIVFYSFRDGNGNPYQKASSGIGQEEVLDKDPRNNHVNDWSRDGRYLIEEINDPKTSNDIWVLPQFGDKKPFPYINTEFREENAKLSPGGQWLAYVSDESKRNEVYVQTFPEHGGKWQISTGGGIEPVWSRDGRELYFISTDRKMMTVEIKASGSKFDAGVPKALFEVRVAGHFDVGKDGRFLIRVPQEQAATNVPITVVVNWQAALKK